MTGAKSTGDIGGVRRTLDHGGHDGSFHKQGHGEGDFRRLPDRFLDQTSQKLGESLLVAPDELGAGVGCVSQFDGGVLKGTAPEARQLEPVLQSCEEGPQRTFRLLGVPFHRRAEELQYDMLPILEDGQDQVVLGRKVLVEAHLGDFGLGNDPVDADCPEAVLVEQPVGGFQDALACFGSLSCASHLLTIQTCLFIVKALASFFIEFTGRVTRWRRFGQRRSVRWRVATWT